MTTNCPSGADVTVAAVAHPYGVQRSATLQRSLHATRCNAPATLQRLTDQKTANTVCAQWLRTHLRDAGQPDTTPQANLRDAGRMVDQAHIGASPFLFRFEV